MADILTQLQACLDQLATQFYATLSYLSQRHPIVPPNQVPNDPYTIPPSTALTPGPEDSDPNNLRRLIPDTPSDFASAQRELARDLVIKGAQIEYLISVLPGIGTREEEQESRIKSLVKKLGEVEAERKAKRREMRDLVKRLENVVTGVAVGGDQIMTNGANGQA